MLIMFSYLIMLSRLSFMSFYCFPVYLFYQILREVCWNKRNFWICFFILFYQFCFMYCETLSLKVIMTSWWTDLFITYEMTLFIPNSMLYSEICFVWNRATPVFLLMLAWYVFFHLLTFNLFVFIFKVDFL